MRDAHMAEWGNPNHHQPHVGRAACALGWGGEVSGEGGGDRLVSRYGIFHYLSSALTPPLRRPPCPPSQPRLRHLLRGPHRHVGRHGCVPDAALLHTSHQLLPHRHYMHRCIRHPVPQPGAQHQGSARSLPGLWQLREQRGWARDDPSVPDLPHGIYGDGGGGAARLHGVAREEV